MERFLAPRDMLPDNIPWNSTTNADAFLVKRTGERTAVGITCGLSIIGAMLIVLSYVCFKQRRTRTREILVHISVMDFGVALANFIGDVVYFDRFYPANISYQAPDFIDGLCRTQAFFAAYCTYGSILWTISLAVYLYFLIVHHSTRLSVYFLRFSYAFCYGLPFGVALWLAVTLRLGYSPYDSSGWCSLINKDPVTGDVDLFITVFGNDLWIYLAIVLIPILYIASRMYIHEQFNLSRKHISHNRFWNALQNVDYKFLLIPFVFILLRIWTCIVNILYLYIGLDQKQVPYWVNKALVYLSGIGDSGQGFVNAILFVVFTKNVRDSFFRCIRCKTSGEVHPEEWDEEKQTFSQGEHIQQSMQRTTSSNQSTLLHKSLESSFSAQRHDYHRYGSISN